MPAAGEVTPFYGTKRLKHGQCPGTGSFRRGIKPVKPFQFPHGCKLQQRGRRINPQNFSSIMFQTSRFVIL
jgi:hypothetical protein